MALLPGTRLDHYEILSPIGAGGMGEVYRARDTRLGREIAIKVLPPEFAADPDRLARFEQEARATGALNHPNILAIHDVGSHGGVPYLVVELLEGRTLRESIAEGPLPVRKAVMIAAQAASGLAAAHERGIVHRDLKPENLFITRDGRLKVLDFGLAKLSGLESQSGKLSHLPTTPSPTAAGLVLGTLGYMAPEQVRGRPADQRSDLFALGAILYEMLSGRRAFIGASPVETMHAILKDEPPDLTTIDAAVPPALDRIVRHCLEKNPEERFQSARDVAFSLDALSGSAAPGVPAIATGTGPAARRRLLLGGVTIVALAATLATGLFFGRRGVAGAVASTPIFQRLTFRHGFLHTARFSHDGQSVVFGAAWDGDPIDVYLTHVGTPESRSLGLEGSNLLAVSPSDELAISKISRVGYSNLYHSTGTLARLPLTGGSPRDIVEQATYADWSPDGSTIAVTRDLGDRTRLEYPVDKVLYETPNGLLNPRISPDGQSVALWEAHASGRECDIILVDAAGTKRTLSTGWRDWWYLAWSPDGKEIWVAATDAKVATRMYAIDLAGHKRTLFSGPGDYDVQDIARDGRVLLGAVKSQKHSTGRLAGWTRDRELTWFSGTDVADIAADGRSLLLSEDSEAGGTRGGVFLKRNDSLPPVRLGEGRGMSLSPDGRWALSVVEQRDLVLLPLGTGQTRHLGTGRLAQVWDARWLPDGRSFVVIAAEAGRPLRLFLLDLEGTVEKPVSEEGLHGRSGLAVSPDGRRVAVVKADGRIVLVQMAGGPEETARGPLIGDRPVAWSADGHALYVFQEGAPPAKVFKVDLQTGRRVLWRDLSVVDPAGVPTIARVVVTPDGQSYFYSYQQILTDLYLVTGLK